MFRSAILVLASVLLASCGGGDSASDDDTPLPSKAIYEGSTLKVGGVAYERKPSLHTCNVVGAPINDICDADRPVYASGELIIKFQLGREQEGMALLQALGVATFERNGRQFLSVPPLFEEQWGAALKGKTAIEYAEPNGIAFPA